MNISEFSKYDGLGLSNLVKSKQVKPEELVSLSIKAIKELNPDLNAVVSILEEEALNEIKAGLTDGPFTGVPFLIKELVLHAANVPTSMGSRLAEGTVFPVDSELMARFKKAGFVTIGTTTTPEFGYNAATEAVLYGPTRNPWNKNHSPGGSSGGSAAAVAAGIVPVAHANDGGGSIRIPASCSGLIGLKPTRGRIPAGPYNSEPLNGIAIEFGLTKTVRDTAYLLDAVSGPDVGCYGWPESPAEEYKKLIEKPIRPLKIALMTKPVSGVPVDEECLKALNETAQLCKDLGHIVVEDTPKYDPEELSLATLRIWTANIYNMIEGSGKMLNRTPSEENIEAAIWQCYLYGKQMKASELLEAIDINAKISRMVGHFFTDYDVLLSPTIATLPAKIGFLNANNPSIDAKQWTEQIFTYAPFTNLFNATGQPSISLPLKTSKNGLPIGMQFTGRFADEATLLQLATQLEKALPWNERKPEIHASNIANIV